MPYTLTAEEKSQLTQSTLPGDAKGYPLTTIDGGTFFNEESVNIERTEAYLEHLVSLVESGRLVHFTWLTTHFSPLLDALLSSNENVKPVLNYWSNLNRSISTIWFDATQTDLRNNLLKIDRLLYQALRKKYPTPEVTILHSDALLKKYLTQEVGVATQQSRDSLEVLVYATISAQSFPRNTTYIRLASESLPLHFHAGITLDHPDSTAIVGKYSELGHTSADGSYDYGKAMELYQVAMQGDSQIGLRFIASLCYRRLGAENTVSDPILLRAYNILGEFETILDKNSDRFYYGPSFFDRFTIFSADSRRMGQLKADLITLVKENVKHDGLDTLVHGEAFQYFINYQRNGNKDVVTQPTGTSTTIQQLYDPDAQQASNGCCAVARR